MDDRGIWTPKPTSASSCSQAGPRQGKGLSYKKACYGWSPSPGWHLWACRIGPCEV